MRELDLVLAAFLDEDFETLSDADKTRFEELLEEPDPVILAWLRNESLAAHTPHAEMLRRIARRGAASRGTS
jgi:succinate dehydrogenase flavin-adding protein (antitoxin of CptAB toxin-antitoxin module)